MIGVRVRGNVHRHDDEQVLPGRIAALIAEPANLLADEEAVVFAEAGVVHEQESHAVMIDSDVHFAADVFREQLARIVIAGDFVNRLADRLANVFVSVVLLLAAVIDDVAQVQDDFAVGLFDFARGLSSSSPPSRADRPGRDGCR